MSADSAAVDLAEAWRFVAAATESSLSAGSRQRFCGIWANFERFAFTVGGTTAVEEVDRELICRFVTALVGRRQPSENTVRTRIAALRYLFKELRKLGLADHDPTLDLSAPASSHQPYRLTDEDVDACRWVARTAVAAAERYSCVFAAGEAGASTGEIGQIVWGDVAADGRSLLLAGADVGRPRVVVPTEWGASVLRRAHCAHEDRDALATLRSSGYHSQRTAVAHVLREIFARAGIDKASEPRSLTAWAAHRVFKEAGQLEVAALAIGYQSLDRTARLIGYGWLSGAEQ